MYKKPIPCDYYGLTVWMRLEYRKGGTYQTVILSDRDAQSKHAPKMGYEHPPRRIGRENEQAFKTAMEDYEIRLSKDPNAKFQLDALPEDLAQEFFERLLALDPDSNRYDNAVELRKTRAFPLAAILLADKKQILTSKDRSKSSIEDESTAIRRLMQKAGREDWRTVIPTSCASWLRKESEHAERTCVRVMKKAYTIACKANVADDNPWIQYDYRGRNPKSNQKTGVREHIEERSFSEARISDIIHFAATKINSKVMSRIAFAILLMLCLPISKEEVCALDWGSFCYLDDYPERLSVVITHTYAPETDGTKKKKRTRSTLAEVKNYESVRRLELPTLLRVYFSLLQEKQECSKDEPFLISATHPKQRMATNELERAINKALNQFKPQSISGMKINLPSVTDLLKNTATDNLRISGYEEEELRYIMGRKAQLTSAKFYSDFMYEAEINKRGALQDRWFNRYRDIFLKSLSRKDAEDAGRRWNPLEEAVGSTRNGKDCFEKKNSLKEIVGKDAEKRMMIGFEIPVAVKETNTMPEEDLTFAIVCQHGMSGNVVFQTDNAANGEDSFELLSN